jgi:L-fuculose-phosphate aldolase
MTEDIELRQEREAVSDYGRKMLHQGLTSGTGGNISVAAGDGVAISPSGMPYDDIDAEDVPVVSLDGEPLAGDRTPSSETPMHTMIHRLRDDVGAIVHTHSPYATTFAALGEEIPASHYLVAFAGKEVPVAGYATYGTPELGELAAETLGEEYNACLLQNHGVVAVGADLEAAFETALMVEYSARIHYQALSIGEPIVLPDEEMEFLLEKFEDYGQAGSDN